jgi:septal ring factor EnvC (AmiA/AmiB activator)
MPHKTHKINQGLSLSVLALFCASFVYAADQKEDYEESLQAITAQIKSVSRNLNANQKLLKSERDRLAVSEQEIAQITQKISETEQKLIDQRHKENKLSLNIKRLRDEHSIDIEKLKSLLLHRFQQGSPNYLKMLLNQQNPYAAGRLENYYRYFSRAQQAKIERVERHIQEVKNLESQQAEVRLELQRQRSLLQEQNQSLQKARAKRSASIAKLSVKVAATSEELTKLKQDRQRLNSLLAELARTAAQMKKLEEQRLAAERRAEEAAKKQGKPAPKKIARPLLKGGFTRQLGRLQPPVQGQREYSYGTRLAESGMRAQGMFYATQGPQPVQSIYRGRVLFADYLKGYGLLIIIDHGDDHISLYGHNELLYKKVGDAVETGETVAQSGVSGGLQKPGVYFEIRRNATPIDPAKWLR